MTILSGFPIIPESGASQPRCKAGSGRFGAIREIVVPLAAWAMNSRVRWPRHICARMAS